MPDRILLAWERSTELVGDEHTNSGYISVEQDGLIVLKQDFEAALYHTMITDLSRMARSRPEAEVHFMRLDQKPQPVAMQMDAKMLKLLREDPVKYITATSPPPIRVDLRSKTKVAVQDAVKLRPLRVGYDTLADAFGDEVCIRVRFGDGGAFDAECPGCGRWAGFGMKASTNQYLLRCEQGCSNPKAHGTWVAVERLAPLSKTENPRWAVVSLKELLDKKYERYFLPRAWNTSGPWIIHEDLQKKHEHYLKEKQACLDQTKATDPSV